MLGLNIYICIRLIRRVKNDEICIIEKGVKYDSTRSL